MATEALVELTELRQVLQSGSILDDAKVDSVSPDFRSVTYGGEAYAFTPRQAQIVEVLWEARPNGMGQEAIAELLDITDEGTAKRFGVRAYFRTKVCDDKRKKRRTVPHPAWGKMIQPWGEGIFGIGPPPSKRGQSPV